MSSPAPSNSGDRGKKPLEQITFRFCSECSNMLYPKEDEAERKLLFTCRTCSYSEEATSSCIFRNVLNNAAGETAGVTQDVGSDPTVGASFFDSDAKLRISQTMGPSTYIWCVMCGFPINCQVCREHYAAIPAEDSPDCSAHTNDLPRPDEAKVMKRFWKLRKQDIAGFMAQFEEELEELENEDGEEIEDENEPMDIDPTDARTGQLVQGIWPS